MRVSGGLPIGTAAAVHDLERVLEHVQMVESALLNPTRGADLGQDDIDQAQLIE